VVPPIRLYHLIIDVLFCVSTLHDACISTKLPKDAFLRTILVIKHHVTVIYDVTDFIV
jgi:hypothetical protein